MRGGGPLGDPTGPQMTKNDQNLEFFYFTYIHFTQVEYFCYCYTDLMWRE